MLSLYIHEARCKLFVHMKSITRYSLRLIVMDKTRPNLRSAVPRNADLRRVFPYLYRPGKIHDTHTHKKITQHHSIESPRPLDSDSPRFNRAASSARPGSLRDLGGAIPRTTNAVASFSFSPGNWTDILPEKLLVGAEG